MEETFPTPCSPREKWWPLLGESQCGFPCLVPTPAHGPTETSQPGTMVDAKTPSWESGNLCSRPHPVPMWSSCIGQTLASLSVCFPMK